MQIAFELRAFESLEKSLCESVNLVHENRPSYSRKSAPVRYCQIGVFQGFGRGRTRPRLRPEIAPPVTVFGSRRDAIESGARAALKAPRRRPFRGLQQLLVARLVLRDRMLEGAQRGRPKLHAIQILVQTPKRFDQIPHEHVFCRLRHGTRPWSVIGRSFSLLKLAAHSCSEPGGGYLVNPCR